MAEKTGIKSALAALPGGLLQAPAQGAMFPAPATPRRRGPGRPPGARNKRTLLVEGRLTAKSGEALDELASIAFATPAEIARTWHVDRDLAARLKIDALKELAEYGHVKRRHLKIEGEGGLMQLNINLGGSAAPGESGALSPLAQLFARTQANQKVIEAEPVPSDAGLTDAAPKAEAAQ